MFKKLRGKIGEFYDTQHAFADAMGMSYTALNHRLNGKVDWKASEMAKACELLNVPLKDTHMYFFQAKSFEKQNF